MFEFCQRDESLQIESSLDGEGKVPFLGAGNRDSSQITDNTLAITFASLPGHSITQQPVVAAELNCHVHLFPEQQLRGTCHHQG